MYQKLYIPASAYQDKKLSLRDLYLLGLIAVFSKNGKREFFFTKSQLKELRISYTSFYRSVYSLQDHGFVVIHKNTINNLSHLFLNISDKVIEELKSTENQKRNISVIEGQNSLKGSDSTSNEDISFYERFNSVFDVFMNTFNDLKEHDPDFDLINAKNCYNDMISFWQKKGIALDQLSDQKIKEKTVFWITKAKELALKSEAENKKIIDQISQKSAKVKNADQDFLNSIGVN